MILVERFVPQQGHFHFFVYDIDIWHERHLRWFSVHLTIDGLPLIGFGSNSSLVQMPLQTIIFHLIESLLALCSFS